MQDLHELGWTTQVEADITELLESLKKTKCVHTDYSHSKRTVECLKISCETMKLIMEALSNFTSYLQTDCKVATVQRISLTPKCRTQRLHRDHGNGPRKALTMALSDRPLGTVLFSK